MTDRRAELPNWMYAAVTKAPAPDAEQITKLRAIFRPTKALADKRTTRSAA